MTSTNMPDEIDPVTLRAEIAALIGAHGGISTTSTDDFWRQLAIALNQAPGPTEPDNLKACLNYIGETWDDDFVEEDGSASVAAYETILAWLQAHKGVERAELEEEEDADDDSIGALTSDFNTQVPPITTDVATLMGQINTGELVLNPEWQRSFVWKPQKMRRLIESMLLGLPIPSFLLYADKKGGYTYVIDGRQRLETISRFMSPKPPRGSKLPKRCFKTFPASTEGWRKDEALNAAAGLYYEQFPADLKRKITKTPLVTCTFVDLPPDKLYQIFKRYNTGAVALNANEIRNAVYQASPLHVMMYRLAGEAGDPAKYKDDEEREVGEVLRDVMRGQKERYGAYGFVGRYFAFRYMSSGSVANATNQFMVSQADAAPGQVDALEREFTTAFNQTLQWYDSPLTKPGGPFHAFLATVQMVSTSTMLERIAAGRTTEVSIRKAIQRRWPDFAAAKLLEKQNSTLFWSTQREWIGILDTELRSSLAAS